MSTSSISTIADLAARIPDGAKIAVPNDSCGVAMSLTREIVRRGVRNLHLVCVPVSGLQAEILIGSGCIGTLETSAVTLGEHGPAPRFVDAVRQGHFRLLDATCPAIHAAIQAGMKNIPFIPLRGMVGSDMASRRTDWKVIDNPFATEEQKANGGDPIVLLPAIRPDFAVFHTPLADRFGNVWIGRKRELLNMAQAAFQTLVTVEQVTERNLMEDEAMASGCVPSIYVTGVAEAPMGAWPVGLWDRYGVDDDAMQRYVSLAKSVDGFRQFLDTWPDKRQVAA